MWRFLMTVVCVCGLCGVWTERAQAEENKAEKKVSLRPIDVAAPAEATAEAKIRKALDERTDLEFTETELSTVAAFLADKFKIDVQLDLKPLEDASIGPETPVTRHLKDVSLRLRPADHARRDQFDVHHQARSLVDHHARQGPE